MNKRKRGSTWYRQVHEETENVLSEIFRENMGRDQNLSGSSNFSLLGYEGCGRISSTNSTNSSDEEFDFSCNFNRDLSNNELIHLVQDSATPDKAQSCSNNDGPVINAHDKLKKWAIKNKITLSAMNELLEILANAEPGVFKETLPKDARTFLATPRKTLTRHVDPGEYYHFGIEKSMENMYTCYGIIPNDPIEIGINIDGLPIAKSSNSQFYPILGLLSKHAFLIGLYHGYEKPKNFNEFLLDFVNEAKNLSINGISLFGIKYNFKINKFLFDAVAKASVLAIKGHSGYSSCTKCCQYGASIQDRICFPLLTFQKRTHESFVQQADSGHHSGRSILLDIPNIDIIADVPLDYMHLVLLGVVKKLLSGLWCHGPPSHKISNSNINVISNLLLNMAPFVPSEFARTPRSLKEVKRWKATEFRQFLLYTGPVVLKNLLPKRYYQNFLILSISIRILSSEKYCFTYINHAEQLLVCFVKTVKEIYGPHLLTHNFHNLLHLVEDVKKFGILDNFSNFDSENFLQYLGSLIRKHDKPLQQVVRRYYECMNDRKLVIKKSSFELKSPHCEGPLLPGCSAPEFKSIVFADFKLSSALRDSCCAMRDGSVVEIKNFAFSKALNDYVVIGKNYLDKKEFFDLSLPSSFLDIFSVNTLGEMKCWPVKDITHKFVRIPFDSTFIALPLVHTQK